MTGGVSVAEQIKFGTDGWRGITAYDFTYANVLLVTEAVSRHLHGEGKAGGLVLIGFDTRFLAREFAHAAAHHLKSAGFMPKVTAAPVPTPAIAFGAVRYGAAGAIQFTASHNPYYYNGFKFIMDYGGPALPETTDSITAHIREIRSEGFSADAARGEFKDTFDVKEDYFAQLNKLTDASLIAAAGMKILYNPLWATGAGWLDDYLTRHEVSVKTVNANRDVLFGGFMPDPNEKILAPMRNEVLDGGFSAGLATDGDSDRFAAFDACGEFMTANQLIPIIAHYLIRQKGMRGPIVRTVVTTSLLDRIAAANGLELIETPVGFKYVGDEIRKGALCGGEESGGFSMAGHVPEKDGILANILACEAAAAMAGGDLGKLRDEIFSEYGPSYFRRNDLHLTPEGKAEVMEQASALAEHFKERGGELWGAPVESVVTIDGVKFVLSGGRSIAIRPSGTEPVVRVYIEAPDAESLDSLDEKSSRWIETTAEV